MPSATATPDTLDDLKRAVDRANDAVRAYVVQVEGRRRSGAKAGSLRAKGWTVRQTATLARLQTDYLVAFAALRAAAEDGPTTA